MGLQGVLIWMFFWGRYKKNAPQDIHLLQHQQTIQKRKIHLEYKCERKC